MNHYVVRIERIARAEGEDVKLHTYLCKGGEVQETHGATHFGSPGHAYDALDAYGKKVARRSPLERKAMFMEVIDLRGPKIDREEYIAQALQQAMDVPFRKPDHLSVRELQLFGLRLQGKSCEEIAAELGLSIKTVGTYRCRLKEKLGIPDTGVSLALYAMKLAKQR